MYIVKAENILNSRKFAANFDTEQDANEWLQARINKQSWGKNARQAVRGIDNFDESLVLSEFEDTDEFGETRTIVSLKAEYTFDGPTLLDGSGSTPEDKSFRMSEAKKKAAMFKVFKDFGETVELYFTALINERNYTQEQKDSVQSDADVLAILSELKFGRIAKCKAMVDAKASDDALFYTSDLNAVSQLMADFLEDYTP